MGIVFLFPTTPQTSASEMNYSVVVLGGVLGLSVIWYYFPVYGGVHWFTGPIPNVEKAKGVDSASRMGVTHHGHGHEGSVPRTSGENDNYDGDSLKKGEAKEDVSIVP